MVKNSPLLGYLLDQLEPLGGISSRIMFGGHSLFRHGLMVGFVDNETLYLKADDINRPAFENEGMRPFTYATKRGKRIALGYWEAPPAVIEEPEALQRWVLDAASAARRNHDAKTPRKSPRKGGTKVRKAGVRARK
jgi:DNA transformation protein and related proteins